MLLDGGETEILAEKACPIAGFASTKHTYTGLVKIMLTLMDYFSPADRRTPWVTDLNGTVARWLLCVKHDGKQVETVL